MAKLPYVNEKEVRQTEPVAWLLEQPKLEKLPYLLAFADDGVIWGGFVGKIFKTSAGMERISPQLRAETLQQAFVFGEKEEIRLFKDESGNWQARSVTDRSDFIVESQVLWGDRAYPPKNGFTRVFDARQQGLDHLVPLEIANSRLDPDEDGQECLRLEIHHLVEYDPETGEARIALSRLAGLSVGKRAMEVEK